MDAIKIFEEPDKSFVYMERYVNNGSPSGWTKLRSTSSETNPFTGKLKFNLLEFYDGDIETEIIGEGSQFFSRKVNYAHPDSRNSLRLLNSKRSIEESSICVYPTSGGRTMFVCTTGFKGFIKLTYDVSRIGRVDRQLKYEHCMSSIEVSAALKRAIDEKKFKQSFSVLLEKSAKVSRLPIEGDAVYEWGTIIREFLPYPYVKETRRIIPGFSMFGKDYFSSDTETDELLINQFIILGNKNPEAYLKHVLKITVDAWFQTLLNCAFILEMHGQNCYYEIDEEYNVTRIVVKDMDSVDKDITLAKKLGLKHEWKSYPFECFYEDEPEDHPWYYKIRPTYMYDFKLGTYLLNPMIDAVCNKFFLNKELFYDYVKNYVNETFLRSIPNGYFPIDGSWYDCDNSERKPGERRKYFSHPNPRYR